MSTVPIPLLLLLGASAGLVSGALAVGGGLLLIALLLWITPLPIEEAGAVALLHGLASGLSAVPAYRRAGALELGVGVVAAVAAALGGFAGGLLAGPLPSRTLEFLFLFVLLGAVVAVAVPLRRGVVRLDAPVRTRRLAAAVLGLCVGTLAGLIGIGGGVFFVPGALLALSFTPPQAVATALVVGIATAGTALVARVATGHVPVAVALIVAMGSLPGARIGAALHKRLSPTLVRVLIIVVLSVLIVRTSLSLR